MGWVPVAEFRQVLRRSGESSAVFEPAHCIGVYRRASAANIPCCLRLPENIKLLPLPLQRHSSGFAAGTLPPPPYNPERNPRENVWDYKRQDKLCSTLWNSYDEIVEACTTAWNWLIDAPDRI
jgi:hypothetical protein